MTLPTGVPVLTAENLLTDKPGSYKRTFPDRGSRNAQLVHDLVGEFGTRSGGITVLDMDAAREAGASLYQRQRVSHGISVEVYDEVPITPTNEQTIEEEAVVDIETTYYESCFRAAHGEDSFVVGASGNRLLTSMPRTVGAVER